MLTYCVIILIFIVSLYIVKWQKWLINNRHYYHHYLTNIIDIIIIIYLHPSDPNVPLK